jgi:hypothetical protein
MGGNAGIAQLPGKGRHIVVDQDKAVSWARAGWARANTVKDDPAASRREKELAQALAEIAYAVVELGGGNR